jgi:hypothetical protein
MKKELISESRLREIISEEAARFKKKLTLEAEKKKILNRLQEMYMEEEMTEEELEEGLFGFSKEELTPKEIARREALKIDPKNDAEAREKGIAVITDPALKGARANIYNKANADQKAKYLIYYGYNPNAKLANWNPELEAPDGTLGYFQPSGLVRGAGGSGKNMGASE